jgi:hypothetical protein
MRRCIRCVLSEAYPGITFNVDGVCNYCRAEGSVENLRQIRRQLRDQLDASVETGRRAAIGDYDCIVALSGGKDSSYTLWLMATRYKLRCLAVTVDNGFLSQQAVENCHLISEGVGADHLSFRPAFEFMRSMYAASVSRDVHAKATIKRASAICSSCISLINNQMVKLALQMRVPIIAGGYLGGQVPKDAAVLELSTASVQQMRTRGAAHFVEAFGPAARKFFTVNAADVGDMDRVIVCNPLLAFDYLESEIVDTIARFGWHRPNDTGAHSSNCRLNDVGILVHIRRHGFHPYEAELADLVRKGLMDRKTAVTKLESLPDRRDFSDIVSKLGIDDAAI